MQPWRTGEDMDMIHPEYVVDEQQHQKADYDEKVNYMAI
jgi:hypothetical protein